MGMVTNKLQVYVLPRSGSGIFFDYCLPDEICAELTRDEALFSGAATTGQLIDRMGCGFRDYWADEDAKGLNFLNELFEMYRTEEDDEEKDGSGDEKYDAFVSCVADLALPDIRAVVLMTDQELEGGDRGFSWICYDLANGKTAVGTGTGTYIGGGNRYDPGACEPSAEAYITAAAEGK